eukprot:TRINITY_DN13581_c0_g1_i2.p1 TRINITY_DN13581_c0_g1~~TRINITY_DN13581_c0_g1_i2.p1  ORF type:complete len:1015 (+),score=123.15 TRINITY_DN13581_c0_g1_i2:1-3045(+)
MVSDRAMSVFLAGVLRPQLSRGLEKVCLSGCLRMGARSFEAVVNLVEFAGNLRTLDLSRVSIGLKFQYPLCEAISQRKFLEIVKFTDSGMGKGTEQHNCQWIRILLKGEDGKGSSVTQLELGWNSFGPEFFTELGECLATDCKLKTLSLVNTAASASDGASPISYFLEHLCRAMGLESLDVSMNRINFRAALIIEDNLQCHQTLKTLNTSDNPLGVVGIRSILRALAQETSKLTNIDISGCFSGEEPSANDFEVFSATRLASVYKLILSRPYDRALLRMLYKACERFGLLQSQVIEVLETTDNFSHTGKGSDGLWHVPHQGKVTLFFNTTRCLEAAFTDIKDNDFSAVLQRYFDKTRHQPARSKAPALFACWKQLDGNRDEQIKFLLALSKDFAFSLSYVEVVASLSRLFRSESIQQLLPSIPLDNAFRFLAQMNYGTVNDCLTYRRKLKWLLNFNPDNPTGHYKLDLENSSDFAVAEQLVILDKWEIQLDKRLGRFDISSAGNNSHARNEYYQARSLLMSVKSFSDWKIPDFDDLELDYVSTQCPPEGSEPMDGPDFDQLLLSMHESLCADWAKIGVLRRLSHYLNIDSLQMRQMLGFVNGIEHRSELFICFFNRLTERHNSKLYFVRFDSFEEIQHLRDRIGTARIFPSIQPECARFEFDFSKYDHRVATSALVNLAMREKLENIRDPVYLYSDGTQDPLTMGVPRSWQELSSVPTSGRFSCSYICSPEDRCFLYRKEILKKHSYTECPINESEVCWCTGLTEAPSDVILFLTYLRTVAKDMEKAFVLFDGVDGNGVITLREFEEGCETIGMKKFDGKDKSERLIAVFRYLDPGGEGSVSRLEWNVLNQIWSEVETSIAEFVQFIFRTVGTDLQNAWDLIDADGSGEIDCDEWQEAVLGLGYFGPTQVVFQLMDSSGDGQISAEEFGMLDDYAVPLTQICDQDWIPLERSATNVAVVGASRSNSSKPSRPSTANQSPGSRPSTAFRSRPGTATHTGVGAGLSATTASIPEMS